MATRTHKRQQIKKGSHGGWMLVLTRDVAHLGKQGEVVEVKPGYARNYLLPNGLAIIPTEHNLRLLERYKIRVQQAIEAKMADLRVLAGQIQRLELLTIEANAQPVEVKYVEDGEEKVRTEYHLYGSVGPAEISRVLKGKNLKVEPEMVRLEGHIKKCAIYEVDLHLGYDINTKVKVAVVPQKQPDKK